MPRVEPRFSWRSVVLIAIAFAFIGVVIFFRAGEGVAVTLSLSLVGLVGIWFIALPFMPRRRAASRWFRHTAITCGIAAVLSASGHALLLLQPHRFDRVRHFELQTFSIMLSGVWLGLLVSLFASEELWDSHKKYGTLPDEKT
jgi:hypothetical protein